jgi:glycosyltransferase involved in cell wall biosynthesis
VRVIHISGARVWGGNEQQLGDIVPSLNKLGVDNLVFGVPNSPLHKYCVENDIEFIECKNDKLNKFINYIYLKKVVKKYKPDILHLHTSDSVTVFTISDILFNLKIPTVSSKKGMGKSMSFLSIYKYNYRNIKKILCVSKAVKFAMESKVLKTKNEHKLTVVYEGINVKRISGKSDKNLCLLVKNLQNKVVLGNTANHVNAKDLPTLINMMDYLVNYLKITDVHLVQIGGFSQLTESLKSQINELGLNKYITLLGFQNDATHYLEQFDIFVMSSEREGLPLTIYEAFYKKVPVVSTKAGGISEIINDGENGFLAETKDYKMLANKIKILIDKPELMTSFSEESFIKLNEFYTSEKAAKNILEVYNSVI